jgi:hypothetical protein
MSKNSAGVEMTHLAPEGNLWDNVAPYIRRTDVFALEPMNSENPHTFQASGYEDTDEETSRRLYGYERLAPVEYEAKMQPRAKVTVKVGTRAVSTAWRTSDDEAKSASRLICPHEGCEKWYGSHNKAKLDKHILTHGGQA